MTEKLDFETIKRIQESTTGPDVSPVPLQEIPRNIINLRTKLEIMETCIARLTENVAPVLLPDISGPPQPQTKDTSDSPLSSDLGAEIDHLATKLQELYGLLEGINERIAL